MRFRVCGVQSCYGSGPAYPQKEFVRVWGLPAGGLEGFAFLKLSWPVAFVWCLWVSLGLPARGLVSLRLSIYVLARSFLKERADASLLCNPYPQVTLSFSTRVTRVPGKVVLRLAKVFRRLAVWLLDASGVWGSAD